MKVLWFTNTPSLAESYINNKPAGGGWIKSLEKEIQRKVELYVVFYHDKDLKPFKFGETIYFPIRANTGGKLTELKNRILTKLEPREDISTFLKVIERIKPDLIHIHGTENQFGLIQQFTNVPTVVSIQGVISVCSYRYFIGLSYLDILKHSKLTDLLLFKSFIQSYKSYSKSALREKEVFKLTKHVIGRTTWDRRIAKVLAPNATYSHNDEILRDIFYKVSWSYKPDNTLRLFTTTGHYIYKGLETILYAAHLLDEQNIKFKWQIAGLSRESKIVRLTCKKMNKPLSKNVELLGQLGEDELIQHLLQTHIYIMASHIENSPNNLCEAQILGVPCIATSAGGTSSLVNDNDDGILIQDGDPYVMTGAIIELMNNYEKAIFYGQNARKKALTRHDPKKIVEELLIIYNQLVNCTTKNKADNLMQVVKVM